MRPPCANRSGVIARVDAPGLQRQKMQPAVVEQRGDLRMAGQDRIDGRCRRVQLTVSRRGSCAGRVPSWTACHGRPARSRPPLPSTTPMPPVTLWISLLPPPNSGAARSSVILQADPVADDDRGRQDQLQHLEVGVQRPVIAVQEDAPAKVQPRVVARGAAMKAAQPASPHSGRVSAPFGRAGGDGRGRRAGQALCPSAGSGRLRRQPVHRAGQVGRVAGGASSAKSVTRSVVVSCRAATNSVSSGSRDAVGGQGGTGVGIVQQTRQDTGRDLSAAPPQAPQ